MAKKKIPQKVKEVRESVPELRKEDMRVSYSELSTYTTCPKKWELLYLRKALKSKPTIHLVFGTAMHETIQQWLKVMYQDSIKASKELKLDKILYSTLYSEYRKRYEQDGVHFSTLKELRQFYIEGCHILEYLKKQRIRYFSRKNTHLAGIETLLYQEIHPGIYFKGYIDLVFYDEDLDRWNIIDIKTSTSGWKSYAKKDFSKLAQVLLYKKYFSEQFNIPIEKIEVKYHIVKRQVPKDAEFAVMQRRVQEFSPPSGKINIGRASKLLTTFLEDVYPNTNTPVDKQYKAIPGEWSCKFCDVGKAGLCEYSYYKISNEK